MSAILALFASLSWGSADFLGGMATRRAGVLRSISVSYPAGAVILTPIAIWLIPGTIDGETLWYALGVGAVGAVSLSLLYGALARGPMGVVSPVTAVIAAALPVLVGLAQGEQLPPVAFVGMALAVVAVVLVSRQRGEHVRAAPLALVLSAAAGLGIGGYLTLLGLAPESSGIWVSAGARWVSTVLVVGALVIVVRPIRMSNFPWVFALCAGVLDALGNAIFQLAAQRGELAIVAVLGSLYPAATVLLARAFLGERMSRVQAIGVLTALVAAAILSLG
ncbi:MAG: DMT family transporter [Candidatus Nanopelagicales bacterium]